MRPNNTSNPRAAVLNSDQGRAIHLAFALFLAATAFPFFKTSPRDHIPWYDWVLALAGVSAALYLIFDSDGIAERAGLASQTDILGAGYPLIVPYIVMIIGLLVRPYGLFGTPEIRRV